MNTKNFFAVALLLICQVAAAQCDPTLPRAHLITCLSNQQQSQTGSRPHESQFNRPGSLYQQPAPTYQQPVPTYQTPQSIYQQPPIQQPLPNYQPPPVQWVPSNQGSTYRLGKSNEETHCSLNSCFSFGVICASANSNADSRNPTARHYANDAAG